MGIHGTFRFHKVGQGLFYSGILNQRGSKGHQPFVFVYDCGTESSKRFLDEEIEDFKLILPKKDRKGIINLLVVSHLHDDHVNGLEKLLKDVAVDTVVMPYVDEGIKLLAQLESHDEEPFLRTFYTDPVAWFASKGVRRVFLVGAEERFRDIDRGYLNLERFLTGIEGSGFELSPGEFLGAEDDLYEDTEVVYLKRMSKLLHHTLQWEFSFENLPKPAGSAEDYIKIVENFIKKNLLTLEQIMRSPSLRKALGKELDQKFSTGKAINRTSVVLFHRPVKAAEGQIWVRSVCCGYNKASNCGTALTGDIQLNRGEELHILEHCLLFQYPHHGAKGNNMDYFGKIPFEVCLIPCGAANRYGHPDSEALGMGGRSVIANERTAFDYQIHIM